LGDELTVGRGGGCGVVLPDDTFISTVHARLFRRGTELFVEDLASRNGTFVNGEAVTSPTRLRRGDRVQFGQTVGEVVR
jgi:pSer/pThr/pTyr-binding forkhead associated (FHA) protein